MRKNPDFSNRLIMWYLMNKRDLPWRRTKDPYFIWMSEIILQQTRVSQGIGYYEKFSREFPDVFSLAKADEKKVMKLWQGLGYYSRARNMHHTSKFIIDHYNGEFPQTYKELIKLKGIGDYTASAIASIAFDEQAAAVDGNVYRVLSRYFGVSIPINSTQGKKYFKELAQSLIHPKRAGDHNQALMEFGAVICTPKNPSCKSCTLNDSCLALQNNNVEQLPVKNRTVQIKKMYLDFLVLNDKNGSTVLRQRTGKGIWQNLFEFPSIESEESNEQFVPSEAQIRELFGIKEPYKLTKFNSAPIIHKLTHRTLFSTFWIIETDEGPPNTIRWSHIHHYALPVLLQRFVDKYQSFS